MKLSDIEKVFKDEDCKVINDCEFERIHLIGKKKIDGEKTVSYIESPSYLSSFLNENINGVICTKDVFKILKKEQYSGGVCISETPRKLLWQIHNYITDEKKIKRPTRIAEGAKISNSAIISEQNVTIEDDVIIMDNVIIKEKVCIGKGSIIHENVIIGTPGFYYYGNEDERKLVHSAGGVIIGSNVEVHPGTVIQKGVLGGNTEIGNNVKIDMLCKIGHDAVIGDNCTITGGSTISAGNKIGDDVFFGIGSVTVPNIQIGDSVKVSAGTVVGENVSNDVQIINMNNFNNKKIKIK